MQGRVGIVLAGEDFLQSFFHELSRVKGRRAVEDFGRVGPRDFGNEHSCCVAVIKIIWGQIRAIVVARPFIEGR